MLDWLSISIFRAGGEGYVQLSANFRSTVAALRMRVSRWRNQVRRTMEGQTLTLHTIG